jgi:hypothetical protein
VEIPKDAPFVKVMLTVDGTPRRVELDLSQGELDELRTLLKPYFDAKPVAEGKAPATTSTDANQLMRQWAIKTATDAGGSYVFNGETLETPNARGRLSQQWKDAYAMAHTPTDDVHASEEAINAAIAAGEAVKAGKGK